MSCAFIFPGQGAQTVGMLSAFINGFSAGMRVIEEVEDAISFKISRLISEGPIEDLSRTENAQPAIFAATMACIAVLEKEYGYNTQKNVKYLAGHSLGEYTALCVAGVFSLRDAAKIVKTRGDLMSRACANVSGDFSMVAILGLGVDKIEALVRPYQAGKNICVIANDNSSTQVVISGHKSAVDAVSAEAKAIGACRAMEIKTSGPFHSSLMVKAAVEFDKILSSEIEICDFKIPVIMNLTSEPLSDKKDLHSMLVRHITERVRWRESMEFLIKNKIDRIVEIGPGKKQSSMLKRDYPDFNVSNIETVSQAEEFIKAAS